MHERTIEGIVENGRVRLIGEVKLPEKTKVVVVVPESGKRTARIMSPRLVNKSDAKFFVKTVEDDVDDEV